MSILYVGDNSWVGVTWLEEKEEEEEEEEVRGDIDEKELFPNSPKISNEGLKNKIILVIIINNNDKIKNFTIILIMNNIL